MGVFFAAFLGGLPLLLGTSSLSESNSEDSESELELEELTFLGTKNKIVSMTETEYRKKGRNTKREGGKGRNTKRVSK